MQSKKMNTKLMVQLAFLIAIEIIVAITPLGSLPIGPLVATTAHIPVIVAAIVLGIGPGAFMGFVFGFLSLLVWTFMPPNALIAFVFTPAYPPGNFWSVVICIVPRILLGVITGVLAKVLLKVDKSGLAAYSIAAIVGSLLHSLMVAFGIFKCFGESYSEMFELPFDFITFLAAIVGVNGILEAVLAAVFGVAIGKAVLSYTQHRKQMT